ncbi:hypothetical protein [Rubellimicrobium roseum]|uniref:Nuclear transport factor 2 family protein n=1 Tax=Rubellimicrobium roseum TaxID=687525 RepID=A0A5C4NBT7_9RHOB|nr:hypothetical protein [Rubellimicrobium roseum]TNC71502.1 hypothetical protein FHG71_11195 [Rubellimicrobium roseum]
MASRKPLGVTDLFTRMGQDFVAGRFRAMTEPWIFPCPVEMDGHLVVMRSPEDLEDYFRRRFAAHKSAGIRTMAPRISAIEVPRQGRFRVWLRWIGHYDDHQEEDDYVALYYLKQQALDSPRIEMMDVVHCTLVARSDSDG